MVGVPPASPGRATERMQELLKAWSNNGIGQRCRVCHFRLRIEHYFMQQSRFGCSCFHGGKPPFFHLARGVHQSLARDLTV
jgi:hypothetical protein